MQASRYVRELTRRLKDIEEAENPDLLHGKVL